MQKDYVVEKLVNTVERLSEQQTKYLQELHKFLHGEEYQEISEYLWSLNLNLADVSDKVVELLKSVDNQ